jgi:hypothetical protein
MDEPAASRTTPRATLAALLLATALAFAPGLRNGFVWDDAQLIVANAAPLSADTLLDAFGRHFWDTAGFTLAVRAHFYRPVVTIAYALTRALLGAGPLGFHLVNLGVHLSVVALAFEHLRRRLDPAGRSAFAPVASAVAVAFFALHPARAESVAWASGAPDLWAALLLLVALRLDPSRRPLPAALAFALALLSKEAVAFVPAALVVDALLLRPASERRPQLRGAAVLFAVLLAVLGLRALVIPHSTLLVGAPLAATTRVLASLGHLLARTFVPWPLTVWSSRVAFDAHASPVYPMRDVALGLVFVLSVLAAAVAARRSAALRPFAADLAWFALALLPVANPLDLGLAQLVADRYLYIPHLALSALLGRALLARLDRSSPVTTLSPLLALLAVLGALSFAHARHFRDEEALWRHEVSVDPENPLARLSLARAIASRRRYGVALAEVRRALLSAHSQNARAVQMDGVLLAAAILVDGLPDADQRGLGSVRSFLDALGNHPGQPAQLDAGGLRMQLLLGRDDAARVRAMSSEWALPLAESALRTLAPLAAQQQFAEVQRRLPGHPRGYVGAALALVLLDRHDEARRALERAPAIVAPGVARTLSALRSPACADDPEHPRARQVRCALALDLREHARRTALQRPEEPFDPGLLLAVLTADVRDGLCRRAHRRLDQARSQHPGWDAAEAARVVASCSEFRPREE